MQDPIMVCSDIVFSSKLGRPCDIVELLVLDFVDPAFPVTFSLFFSFRATPEFSFVEHLVLSRTINHPRLTPFISPSGQQTTPEHSPPRPSLWKHNQPRPSSTSLSPISLSPLNVCTLPYIKATALRYRIPPLMEITSPVM